MKTCVTAAARFMLVGLLTLGIWTPSEGWGPSTGGPLRRLSADFKNFDNTETSTIVGVYPNSSGSVPGDDGTLVYQKTVYVPSGENVLYITISATADTHDGAALWLNCRVDGADCNPGAGGAAVTPAGYVALNKLPAPEAATNCNDGGGGFGDCHDNSINYTWCTPIAYGTRTVELRLATSRAGLGQVSFRTAHFYIDSNQISGNACVQAEPLPGESPPSLLDSLSPLPPLPQPLW